MKREREPWGIHHIAWALQVLVGDLKVLTERVERWSTEVPTDPSKVEKELLDRVLTRGQMERDAPLSAKVVVQFYFVLSVALQAAQAVAGVRALLAGPWAAQSYDALAAAIEAVARATRVSPLRQEEKNVTHAAARWCQRKGAFASYAELYVAACVIAAADDGPEWSVTLPPTLDGLWLQLTDAAADLCDELDQAHGSAERKSFFVRIHRSSTSEPGSPPAPEGGVS